MVSHFGFDFYFYDDGSNFIYLLALIYLLFRNVGLGILIILKSGLFVFGIDLIGYEILEAKQRV